MEWFKLNNAVRAEYRILSLSTSTYLEVIHKDKIFLFCCLNKRASKRLYAIKKNDVPTPNDLVVFLNTKYILAISDRQYRTKDCNVAALPSIILSELRKRLSELPGMGLPKFLIGLPEFMYEKENKILYFYVPDNLYFKDKDTQEKVKKKILPRIILDYPLTDDEKFYDNAYPLPYVKKINFNSDVFFVNVYFDYIVYEKDKSDYKIFFLPAEIPIQEFNTVIDERKIRCVQKTLERMGLNTYLEVAFENEAVKIETLSEKTEHVRGW